MKGKKKQQTNKKNHPLIAWWIMCTISDISPNFKEQVNITYTYKVKIVCQKINKKSFLLFLCQIVFTCCFFRGRGEWMYALELLSLFTSSRVCWASTITVISCSSGCSFFSFFNWSSHFKKDQTILVWLKLMVIL